MRFRLRYRTGVVREQRILWDGDPYDITQVVDVGRRASHAGNPGNQRGAEWPLKKCRRHHRHRRGSGQTQSRVLNGCLTNCAAKCCCLRCAKAPPWCAKAARSATPELAQTDALPHKRSAEKAPDGPRFSRVKAAGHVGVFVNIRPAEGTQYVKHNISGSNTRPSNANRSAARAARMTRSTGRFVNFGTKKRRNKLPATKFSEAGARYVAARP